MSDKPGREIVDCGAIRCPLWFAEALMVLIELEAHDRKLKAGRDARKNAEEWLRKYAPAPPSASRDKKGA